VAPVRLSVIVSVMWASPDEASLVAVWVGMAVPFLVVDFPPVTDLPQHVAQIRLFLEAARDPTSAYTIQWFTPYSLVYALLGAAWAVCPPAAAGRVAVLVLAVSSALAVHWLAARRNRPVAAAALASVLVFNHALYWGFLSFMVGWLAFIVWFQLTTRDSEGEFGWTEALQYCGTAVLLYDTHAPWFALGMLWLVLASVTHQVPLGSMARILARRTSTPRCDRKKSVSDTRCSTAPIVRSSAKRSSAVTAQTSSSFISKYTTSETSSTT